jgi:hypothetical protein
MKYSNTCIFGNVPPLPAGFYPSPLRHSSFDIHHSFCLQGTAFIFLASLWDARRNGRAFSSHTARGGGLPQCSNRPRLEAVALACPAQRIGVKLRIPKASRVAAAAAIAAG